MVLFLGSPCDAQVTLDGTLGRTGSIAGPNYSVTPDLGRQLGGNLFHSFSRFDVRSGESATFSGPASVANIIARVTGGSTSSIDGLLRSTIANASLYLINPKGVAFGPNASLDIGGSFHVASADYLKHTDGARFEVTTPAASTLTSAAPASFGFLGPNPAAISANGTTLAVPPGKALSFVGGDIRLDSAFLSATGGQVNLVSMASPAEVAIGPAAITITPSAPRSGTLEFSGSQIDVSSAPGLPSGSIFIRGGKLTAVDSGLSAFNSDSAAGGAIAVTIDGEFAMQGGSVSSVANAAGDGNSISVAASELLLTRGAKIAATTAGTGQGAQLRISAAVIDMDYGNLATEAAGAGNAGKLIIDADRVRLVNDSVISTITEGTGAGGDIQLGANSLEISGGRAFPGGFPDPVTGLSYAGFFSGIYTTSQGATSGSGGTLRLSTGSLRIADGGTISGITLGAGNAGSFIIAAQSVSLERGGLIHNSTSGRGAAGSISVNASQSISASGTLDLTRYAGFAPRGSNASGIVSKATLDLNPGTPSLGNGGAISLLAPSVSLTGGAEVSTSAEKNAAGGTITVNSSRVAVSDGANISSESSGSGNAGKINIAATDALSLLNGSSITTQAISADGGDIEIRAGSLVHLSSSRITTSVGTGLGNGGNIRIDPEFVVLDKSRIVANAFGGNGGNIRIVAGNFVASPDSVVDASSQLGIDGNVQISSPQVNVGAGLGVLPSAFFDASSLLRESCAARAGRAANSLVGVGRGGLPAGPEGLAFSGYTLPLAEKVGNAAGDTSALALWNAPTTPGRLTAAAARKALTSRCAL